MTKKRKQQGNQFLLACAFFHCSLEAHLNGTIMIFFELGGNTSEYELVRMNGS